MDSTDGAATAAAQPDMRALHQRAAARFAHLVSDVRDDQWSAPTPCSEWNVRALVDHVVRWNTLVPDFLAGLSVAEMERPFERDVLGANPVDAAASTANAAVAAFAKEGALERVVRHPYGELPGAQVMFLRLFDNAVHGWDLATAIKADAHIDLDTAGLLLAYVEANRAAVRASGAFGPAEVEVPPDASVQSRLLGILGRRG